MVGANFFEQALRVAEEIGYDLRKAQALSIVARSLSQASMPNQFSVYLDQAIFSHGVWKDLIPEWQQSLVDHQPQRLDLIRNSLGLFPFDMEIGFTGVCCLVQALIVNRQLNEADAIIRQCPQLELPLLTEDKNRWAYDNLEEWIEAVDDEDDREEIRLWARKVKKGKMTPAEFDERVQSNFG